MRKTLLLLPVLALGLALAAGSGAATPKKKAFDKRFDCRAAMSASHLNSVYASNNWSTGVTLKGAPENSRVDNSKDGHNDVSVCTFTRPDGGWGGQLVIIHGTGALTYYKKDFATATQVGKNACKSLAAKGQQPADPRDCGPVALTSLGGQGYEFLRYLAVIRGDVFVQFEAGGVPDDGSSATEIPTSILESVVSYVFSRVPKN